MSEIAEAAERRDRWKRRVAGESLMRPYSKVGESIADERLLADFAMTLTDPTPITEELLKRVGFTFDEDGWWIQMQGNVVNRLYWLEGLVSVRGERRRHISLCTGARTVGQLRMLCAALSITLTE